MATYPSESFYIKSSSDLKQKICKIQQIIDALEDLALDSVANQDTDEYSLDDGQTKIKTKYRGHEDIMLAISRFDELQQRYINRLNGRVMVLKDKNSLRR